MVNSHFLSGYERAKLRFDSLDCCERMPDSLNKPFVYEVINLKEIEKIVMVDLEWPHKYNYDVEYIDLEKSYKAGVLIHTIPHYINNNEELTIVARFLDSPYRDIEIDYINYTVTKTLKESKVFYKESDLKDFINTLLEPISSKNNRSTRSPRTF